MPRFYNPYHFVPVVERTDQTEDITVDDDFKKGNLKHVTHDKYLSKLGDKKIYSGRLICRLTTEGPIFIGSERNKDTHKVSPFELDPGTPALPASSLRGMISSIAEAASNSSLRVLENMHYSRRMTFPGESNSALGMIIEKLDNETGKKKYELLPLALPPMRWNNNGATVPNKYRKMFKKPLLKVYINGYYDYQRTDFLQNKNPKSFSADNLEFWYLKLQGNNTLINNTISHTYPKIKRINNYTQYLVGQQFDINSEIILENEYQQNPKNGYTRGILRVLGLEGREDNIPASKKHEIFIPFEYNNIEEALQSNDTFDAQKAVELFHALAQERTELNKKMPFDVKGSNRNSLNDLNDKNIELRQGDIVFFEPDASGNSVAEVSISSIWRKEVKGSSYDFFNNLSPEILPFNQKRRKKITIAEQMFGFVEKRDGQPDNNENESGLALAGRIRFSFGKLSSKELEELKPYHDDKVLLKILDSPKPPCPTMYFKNGNNSNEYIGKKYLALNKHIPQGRKFYLHNRDINNQSPPWKTKDENDNLEQKSYITPIKKGNKFYFHIDFSNLSEQELGLLCYAVRPTEEFRHKLGMGKPLGLGQVRIDPIGLFFIDRSKRYSETDLFNSNRYHEYWIHKDAKVDKWPEEYQKEQQEYQKEKQKAQNGLKKENYFDTIRSVFKLNQDIKTALELIGNPDNIKENVHYPQVGDFDLEKKLFQWFVENDKLIAKREKPENNHINPEHLKPLNKDSKHLSSLNRLNKTHDR